MFQPGCLKKGEVMTHYDRVLLQCLQCYLNGDKVSFNIDADDLQMLLKRAEEHKLLPIVYLISGEKLKEVMEPQKYMQLSTRVLIGVSSQVQRTSELVRVCGILEESGINYIVCKGASLRALYDNADYRTSSDEDLFISADDIECAKELVLSAGYDVLSEKDGELKLVNRKNKMLIELHNTLVGSKDDRWQKIDNLLSSQLTDTMRIETGTGQINVFKPDFGLLSLFVHLYNHFVIGGVGIRQVMDIACYIDNYKSELDMDFVLSALEGVNAAKFAEAVIGICSGYFNVKSQFSCDEELLEDFLCAGIYGDADEGRRHSGTLTKKLAQGEKGMASSLFSAVFPSDAEIVSAHPELKGNKSGIAAYRFRRLKNFAGENGVLKSVSYTGKRKKLLKKLGIVK